MLVFLFIPPPLHKILLWEIFFGTQRFLHGLVNFPLYNWVTFFFCLRQKKTIFCIFQTHHKHFSCVFIVACDGQIFWKLYSSTRKVIKGRLRKKNTIAEGAAGWRLFFYCFFKKKENKNKLYLMKTCKHVFPESKKTTLCMLKKRKQIFPQNFWSKQWLNSAVKKFPWILHNF